MKDHSHDKNHSCKHEHCDHEHEHCDHANKHKHCCHDHDSEHCRETHSEHTHSHGCACGCEHEHSEKESKLLIIRLIIGAIFLILSIIFKNNLYLAMISYLILGYDVLINGITGLFKKGSFSEYLLMSIASIGAFVLGEFSEGCAVMLFYQLGELFSDTASEKSEKSIRELIDIKPDHANLLVDGVIKKVNPETLEIGDIVTVSTGEKIPADGIVIEGKTQLDTSSMTGEAEYKSVQKDDNVISGCINCGSLIKIKVTTLFKDSGISKVMKLLEEIEENKSSSEKFLSVFAKYYTPAVILLALITFLFPTLIFKQSFSVWGYRALVFLVVSCPCALLISVPLAFFVSNGCASKLGILIKGSLACEKLSKIKTIAFDKTGTLTKGAFKLESIRCSGIKAEVLEALAYAEYYSTHPLSEAVNDAYSKLFKAEINTDRISDYTEIPGHGISVYIDGINVLVGNEKLMNKNNIDFSPCESKFTVSHIAKNGKYLGYVEFSDGIKNEAKSAISELKELNIKTILLSGDKKDSVVAVSNTLEIDDFHYELLPHDKVNIVSDLQEKSKVAFVGDGINDAPVISKADIGISMGLSGSDAAIEASSVVILSDDISKIPLSIKLSKKTMKIVWENIIFSIGIKVLIMLLGAVGIANLWLAVFADVGVCFIAILNSLRAFNYNIYD